MERAGIKTELDFIFLHFLPISCIKEIMITTAYQQHVTKQTAS